MGGLETNIGNVWFDEHGIVHKRIRENVHVDLAAFKQSFEKTQDYLSGKKHLLLYDVRPHFTMTDEVMDYLRKEVFSNHSIATAIVSNKLGIRLMVDYVIKITGISIPLKAFSNEEDAVKWLLKYNTQKTITEKQEEVQLSA